MKAMSPVRRYFPLPYLAMQCSGVIVVVVSVTGVLVVGVVVVSGVVVGW